MTAGEAARITALALLPVSGDESEREANLMVSSLLSVSLSALPLHHGMAMDDEKLMTLYDWTERRLRREPLQYILGEWEFFGLPMLTRPGALIPRPETELLAEEAIKRMQAPGYQSALDLCTGSGCIAIAIACSTHAAVTASDVSPDALELAKTNAAINRAKITFLEGDLFAPVDGAFDLIVCNPPYLTAAELSSAQPELRFEPAQALYGGADGLDFYRRIAKDYGAHLNPGGALLLEIGSSQGADVCELFPGAVIKRDYAGLDRIAVCTRRAE